MNAAGNRQRLDILLCEKGLTQSRERARALIMEGKILVNDQPVNKPGTRVSPDDTLIVKEDLPYVSRGGLKLEAAIRQLHLDVRDKVCMDIGASTGGFTDCLLQSGARRVFAVDVGYGQLAWKLRQDPRVVIMERTNIRALPPESITEIVDIAVIDVSFISLKIVIPCAVRFLRPDSGRIIALIKPQFEVGKNKIGKGGVVRDPVLQEAVIADIVSFCAGIGLDSGEVIPSPITGPKGNREFLLPLVLKGDCGPGLP
ncbi:MAG: TlyA family RNA methyltransferase [Thermodesulfobacteriota bacterium]